MDSSDRDRLEAYIASQDYFRDVSHRVAEEMIREFIRRALPWLWNQISSAIRVVRDWLGW